MTLKKLAELAHVSPSTASKALANSREVSEETVRIVRRLARETGYLQQCKERRLSYRKPNAPTVAVICPEIVSVYYSSIVTCLSAFIERRGGNTAVYLSGFEAARQESLLDDLTVCPGVDAVAVIPGAPDCRLRRDACIPVLLVSGECDAPDVDQVSFDLAGGIAEAVRHLQSLGHRRVGYLGETLTGIKAVLFRRAMENAGLSVSDASCFVSGGRFEQAGYDAACAWMARPDRPTALVAAYDEMAFGALRACKERGIRVPEDVSLIGMNDIPGASFAPVSLTTVHMYVEEACERAAELLLRKIADPACRVNQHIHIPCRLIRRETTGPAPIPI